MNKHQKLVGLLVLGYALIGVPSQGSASGGRAISCPAQKFDRYIKVFADDVAVQRTHTRVPFKSTVLVDAEPEPRAITRWLGKEQIRFPLMPSSGEQHEKSLQLRVRAPSSQARSVELSGVDTGYLIQYRFEYQSGCWTLVSMADRSL